MWIDSVVSFDQTDADMYTLVVDGDEIHMHTFEAVRLYKLVRKQLDEYVSEMGAAWDSYRRGDGPNGEPAGTWETDTQALHGYRCCDPEADWIHERGIK